MPIDSSLLAPYQDPIAAQSRGFNYADQVRQSAAKYQAGSQYAAGDYSGAAATQAQAGDIPQAQQTQQYAQQTAAKGQAYIAQALPVFAKIAEAHAGDPDKGAAALGDAFDHIAPEAQALTGANPQSLAAFRQSLVSDPQGTLARLQAQVPTEYKTAGDSLLTFKNGVNTGQYEGLKNTVVPQGAQAVQTGGGGNMLAPGSSGSQTPGMAAPAAPGGSSPAPVTVGNQPAPSGGQPPLGIRANNPGNLQPHGQEASYETPTAGVLAASENLDAYGKMGINTVSGIITRWAPPNANNTAAYTQFVANRLGVDPNAPINMADKNVKGHLLEAIFQYENGRQPPLPNASQQAQPQPQAGQPQQPGNARVIATNAVPVDHDAIKNDVQIWLASKGTINPQYGMGAMGATQRQAFDVEKNATMKELGVSPADVASGQAIRKADTKSLGALQQQADSIKAFEGTASKNADLALSLLDKGGPQGQAPILNKWTQEYRKWIAGDQHVSQYTAALGTFADEYAKVVAGQNGATDSVRAAAYDRINDSMNKGTIRAVIGTMKQEMANRSASNEEQLSTIKQRLGQTAPAPSSQGGQTLSAGTKYKGLDVLSPTAAMKLPKGAGFYDTSGVFRVRK